MLPRRFAALVLVAFLATAACTSGDRAAPTTVPGTVGPGTTVTSLAPLGERFEAVTLRVVAADGTQRELCVLLAATSESRATGLMGVTSLEGYDGMLFRFSPASTGRFWMFRTLLPLSVAFFADGVYVSSTDMAPCTSAKPDDCARYGAERAYTEALEVLQGALPGVGIGDGARVEVEGPCER